MNPMLIRYIATLLIMVALDSLWIGFLARDFYQEKIGSLLEFHAVPAVLFYLLYPIGIVVFVSGNADGGWKAILGLALLFGCVAYSTYDLSNLATLRGWSTSLVIVDIVWGSFATAVAAVGGWMIAGYFSR